MALLRKDTGGYGSWEVDLGDPAIKAELGEQLKISGDELLSAINAENVTDKIFARILKNRSKAHAALLDKVPGAKD
jgi:hypothetical protein